MLSLLVNPNFQARVRRVAQTSVGPPLGLAYIAAAAREGGHAVEILDANGLGLDVTETVERVVARRPGVVGITATTPTIELAAEIAAGVKASAPETRVIVGGPHTTALPERSLDEFPSFDFVARGEAETSFPRFLDALASGDEDALTEVPGLAYRTGDGVVVDTGIAPTHVELDAVPWPARDLLPMDRYRCPDSESFTTILAMRGCPFKCSFCAVPGYHGRRMRYRAAAEVAAEMDEVNRRFGTRFFGFIDDTFTTDHKWVDSFLDEVTSRGLERRVRWTCLTRADVTDAALFRKMREAGCVRVAMGIESGSTPGLDFLRKGLSEDMVLRAFADARSAGLSTMGFVILNIPGETEEDVERTSRLVRRADPDYLQVSFLTPYPGTPLWDIAHEKGWVTTDKWSEYSFLNSVILRHGSLTKEELERQYLRFVRGFYFRPRTAWKLGRMLLNGTAQVGPLVSAVRSGIGSLTSRVRAG